MRQTPKTKKVDDLFCFSRKRVFGFEVSMFVCVFVFVMSICLVSCKGCLITPLELRNHFVRRDRENKNNFCVLKNGFFPVSLLFSSKKNENKLKRLVYLCVSHLLTCCVLICYHVMYLTCYTVLLVSHVLTCSCTYSTWRYGETFLPSAVKQTRLRTRWRGVKQTKKKCENKGERGSIYN
jgi:hypothetical protein